MAEPTPIARGQPLGAPSNDGNGGGTDNRLRDVEIRLARAEEKIDSIKENMATKTDISNLKVWILGGILSAIGVAAAIATIIVKAFF